MQPLWISHRGYHVSAAENSAAAFRAAVDHGFTAMETDLRVCRDGHIVLCHDPSLLRLCGDARLVAELSRADLAAVRLRDGSPLLFLDDFLKEFSQGTWTFDIKIETGVEALRKLKELSVRNGAGVDFGLRARFVLWSRSQEELCRTLFPKAQFYARARQCWRAGLSVLAGLPQVGGIKPGRTYALPPRVGSRELYLPAVVEAYQRRGGRVVAYLPETAEQTAAAVAAGVDEVLTNYLPLPGSH